MGTTLNDLHDRLMVELAQLTSGEDWTRMLAAARKFHRYSASNTMLILAQRPDATRVAGFGTWKKLNRSVRKGAKGIAVLAPCTYRTSEDDEAEQRLRGFKVAHVFDISDTDGEELPVVMPQLLSGDGAEDLWGVVSSIVEDEGYLIERSDCRPANGVTNFSTKTVTIRPDLEGAQALKTLCHELGHIVAQHQANNDRERSEVEAESIAYLICGSHGLDSGDYTFPYVAGWSNGDLATVRGTADKVLRLAREVLERIEKKQASACNA